MRRAYRELWMAFYGSPEQQRQIGDPDRLQRPWEPATCTDPHLRDEVWAWLHQVAGWLNQQHRTPNRALPGCWAKHPRLVHELAVVADQRHRAATTPDSALLAEWHRYTLPAFLDRAAREATGCEDGHAPDTPQPWLDLASNP